MHAGVRRQQEPGGGGWGTGRGKRRRGRSKSDKNNNRVTKGSNKRDKGNPEGIITFMGGLFGLVLAMKW
jgi:hypothetical protein